MVIDAGTIAKPNTDVPRNSFMDYYLDHSDVLGGIIKEAKLKAVIITHPDADHYNYIPGFIDLLKGSGTQDNFSECVFFVAKNVPNNYSCLKSNELIKGNIENAIVITKENFENESLKLKKLLFNEEKNNNISFLSPIERGKGLGNNDLSLIIKVVFNKNQSILFTGDATGCLAK